MIDKLNDKPAATIGLPVDAVSVGRSLDKREKGKERRRVAERRKSPRQGCLEDTLLRTGNGSKECNWTVCKRRNSFFASFAPRACPPFLNALSDAWPNADARWPRRGEEERRRRGAEERKRGGGERNEEKTPRRRDAPLDANSKPPGWRPLGPPRASETYESCHLFL